jgi:hypothetical protein
LLFISGINNQITPDGRKFDAEKPFHSPLMWEHLRILRGDPFRKDRNVDDSRSFYNPGIFNKELTEQ